MMRYNKFVIAFDKFKDSLSASQMCKAMQKIMEQAMPNPWLKITTVPLSDGGDGFLDCIEQFFLSAENAKSLNHPFSAYTMHKIPITATGPLGKPVSVKPFARKQTSYLMMKPKPATKSPQIAFIEQATVSGLQMVPAPQRNPFKTTSKGTGELILDSYKKGAKEVYLGIGGSATVDFGIGALHALGAKIYDHQHREFGPKSILTGGDIKDIADIDYDPSKKLIDGLKLHMICDVNSPLLGPNGAVHLYAPQKGAKRSDLPILEAHMAKLAGIIKMKSGGKVVLDNMPKMGAAGAIAAGLSSFLPCEFHSGIEFVANLLELENCIKAADAVITGEGAFDDQTLQGKAVSYVIKTGQKHKKRVIVICGINRVDPNVIKKLGIDMYDMDSRFGTENCFKHRVKCLTKLFYEEIKRTLY